MSRRWTVSWSDPHELAAAGRSLAGLEFLQAVADGRLPPPPIAALLGMTLVRVAPGVAEFGYTPRESEFNPIGGVHGGVICTLLDTATGCAVHTTLAAGVGYATTDITVHYLRPVGLATGALRAIGQVVKPGRTVAFATAELLDADDRVVATASSGCLIRPGG